MVRKIQSYDDLLEYAEASLLGTEALSQLEIGTALDFEIRISGTTWDGSVDYRLAEYIIAIQKAVDKLFKDLGIDLPKEERPIVKFSVEKGSVKLWIAISNTAKTLFENMTSGQKTFLATVALLSTVGYFSGQTFMDYKTLQLNHAHELEQQQLVDKKELEQQKMLVAVIEDLTEKIPVYQAPSKKLIAAMQTGDTVENSLTASKHTKKEIKRLYPDKPKIKAENVYIDGKYIITAIKHKEGKISVEQGTHIYDCQSSLSPAEIKNLLPKVEAGLVAGKGFELDLKVTAKYFKGSNKIEDLIIYEIGGPRKGACTIDSLIGPSI